MTITTPEKEEDVVFDKSLKLRVIPGGKEPIPKPLGKEPPVDDYLSTMEIGTVFHTIDKHGDYILSQWLVFAKTEKSVILLLDGVPGKHPVIPKNFCRRHRLHEVLEIRQGEE